ncbi:glycerophosphodiester phosphodiesterase [Candidatus Saccharibacteria bacterium]|nr:glycerophosphodiester phosphodiesterase [Candidatus Saccharibacteria bacterium]
MKIIGHRGARGLAPENTIASFDAAIAHNVAAIEIDVRTSKDSIPVVLHDKYVIIGGLRRLVSQSTYSELVQSLPGLLTFDAALEYTSHRVSVIVEIKPEVQIAPILQVLKLYAVRMASGLTIQVASFDYKILWAVHKNLPEIEIVINDAWSGVRATHRARKLSTKYIAMNQRWLWSGFISSLTRNGYKLSAYTLNDIKKARRFERAGLYACITDFPDRFNTR